MTKAVRRGEVWAIDFEPQTHRQEPGKKERPALIIQTDALNKAGHPTTIVVPGTSQVDALPPGDNFPLRVRIRNCLPAITTHSCTLIESRRDWNSIRRGKWFVEKECVGRRSDSRQRFQSRLSFG